MCRVIKPSERFGMMRLFVLILVCIVSCNLVVVAQDEIQADSSATVTNSIWDNWYAQAGFDMSLLMTYGKDIKDVFPNGKSFGINVGLGKWFTPDFGLRGNIKWENGILKNDHAIWLGKANPDNGGYLVFSADVMFNMHNLIGEYNPDRKWNLSVYPRMGALVNLGTHEGSPVLGIGVNNTYRLNDRWRLYGDITCQVISSALGFQSGQGSGSNGFLDFTVGVQVDLGNNKFQKATAVPSPKETAVVVNSFWDNWFVQAGLGMSLLNPYGANFSHVFPNGSSFGDNVGLGKWFSPEVGLRGSFNWQNGIIGNNSISWIDADDDPGSNHRAGGWGAAYMDVFLNLHNIFGVYDSNRRWNAIVFPRAGLDSNFDLGDMSPLLGLGIENTYKLNDRWSLYADVAYQVTTGSFMGKHHTGTSSNSNGWFDFNIGVQYELGQVVGWKKPNKVHGSGITVQGSDSGFRVQDGHNWPRFIVNTGASVVVAFGAKTVLKGMIKEERPDHSDNKSFPSGHAAIAFAAARSIDKEFRKDCIWIPIAGYAAATAIGIERIASKRHHWYDVVAGAGIGFGAAELTWWLSDLCFGKGSNVAIGSSGNTVDVAVRW